MKNPMESKPVFPLLMSMAVPPMVSMLIQSMYNIVDSIFVARLGEEALTAVSLAYPLQNLVLAVAKYGDSDGDAGTRCDYQYYFRSDHDIRLFRIPGTRGKRSGDRNGDRAICSMYLFCDFVCGQM